MLALLVSHAVAQSAPSPPSEGSSAGEVISPVTRSMLSNAADDDGRNWLMYGRDYSDRRWSPLDQVRVSNVKDLRVRWMYQLGLGRLGSLETSPIVADGIMYVTAPYDNVSAIDATSGKEIWRYEHRLGKAQYCCGPVNRGVAVADTTVFLLTLDARLIALDARTGSIEFNVEIADPGEGYSETHAPIVVGNKVIVGISGAEFGIRGFVRAYDKDNGKLLWNTYTVPEKGWEGDWKEKTWEGDYPLHRDIAKERADAAAKAQAWRQGGGSVWMNAAVDAESGLVYVAVGNPSPVYDGTGRPGDNLYTDCVLALDLNTGAIRWYYQEVPHDVWDLDAASPPVLVKLSDGRKAVIQAGKTGWLYILDAKTGTLIRKSTPFAKQQNMFALPTAAGTPMMPGANGGANWSPVAVNPLLGYAYVAGIEEQMNYATHGGTHTTIYMGSQARTVEASERYGTVSAVNLNDGRIDWQLKTAKPMTGGALATAGGLVFVGEGTGEFDALDARTGKILWQFNAGAGCNAPPIAYSVNGIEYIAVACGGNTHFHYRLGDAILAFVLPPEGRAASK